MIRALIIPAVLLAALPAAAQGVSALPRAVAAGAVGERYDGYMGFVVPPAPEVRRQVNAVNLKRRNLYIQLASARNATAEAVGLTTACELLTRVGIGHAYMLQDGVWRRRAPGQAAPVPDYCR